MIMNVNFMRSLIIHLEGEYDIYRCEELERMLEPASEASDVIFDLSQTRYIDSASLSVFVRTRKARLAKGLDAGVMVKGSPHIQRVLAITQLDQLWPQFDTLAQAEANLADPAGKQ